MVAFGSYNRTSLQISEQIRRMTRETTPDTSTGTDCKKLISFIDLTSLEGTDNDAKVVEVCRKALQTKNTALNAPDVAAVCFYSPFIRTAKKALNGSGIAVASVAGAFPGGQAPLRLKLDEFRYALDQGADEIDTVLSRGRFLAGDLGFVEDEIAAQKELCGKILLKVILETGELGTLINIRKASEIALSAGADFIKTSTGKCKPAATPEAFFVMAETIREFYEKTGKKVGVKAAGGIATAEQALMYLTLLEEILGKDWKTKHLFRIGASRLLDDLLSRMSSSMKEQD